MLKFSENWRRMKKKIELSSKELRKCTEFTMRASNEKGEK